MWWVCGAFFGLFCMTVNMSPCKAQQYDVYCLAQDYALELESFMDVEIC